MAQAPKVKKETNATRLETLKKNGFIDKSVKTFNKSVKTAWTDFNAAFPNGRVFRKSTLVTVSKDTKHIFKNANMLVVGDKLVFPAEGAQVKVRETAKGIFIDAKRTTDFTGKKIKNGPKYQIILAKDGAHIKYAKELERKAGKRRDGVDARGQQRITYGTLKTSSLDTRDGKTVKTFMRDITMQYETVDGAIEDDRYNEGAADDILADDYKSHTAYMTDVAEANGVHAVIRIYN